MELPDSQEAVNDLFTKLLTNYQMYKRHVVTETPVDESNDAVCMLHWHPYDGQELIGSLVFGTNGLDQIITGLHHEYGSPAWLAFLGDTVYRIDVKDEDVRTYEHGGMQKAFHDGDTSVREALIVQGRTWLYHCCIKVAYHYTDGGEIVYEEPIVLTGSTVGWVDACLQLAYPKPKG